MYRYTCIYFRVYAHKHMHHTCLCTHLYKQTHLHASLDTQHSQKCTWVLTHMCLHGYGYTPMTCSRQHHQAMAEPHTEKKITRPGVVPCSWNDKACPVVLPFREGGYLCASSPTHLDTYVSTGLSPDKHTVSLIPLCTFQWWHVHALPPLLPSPNPLFAHSSSYQSVSFSK